MANKRTVHDLASPADMQLLALALARLTTDRPGWYYAVGEVARKLGPGIERYYSQFREIEELSAKEMSLETDDDAEEGGGP